MHKIHYVQIKKPDPYNTSNNCAGTGSKKYLVHNTVQQFLRKYVTFCAQFCSTNRTELNLLKVLYFRTSF